MKKFIVLIIFTFAIGISAFTQSKFPELDRVKQIKLLESTREDVKRIFVGYNENAFREDVSNFTTKALSINVSYSKGNCSAEDDYWNIPEEGKVISITIFLSASTNPEDLAVDLSSLKKEKTFVNSSEYFTYYDKNLGVEYNTCNVDEINSITLFPPKKDLSLLCDNSTTRKFYKNKRWSNEKTKEPIIRGFANVMEITLSSNEVTVDCNHSNSGEIRSCNDSPKQIEILVEAATSPCASHNFIYNYSVSGGKIIGQGNNVIWDLSGAEPGTYVITVGVNNGCGVCGTTKTETVEVKESPKSPKKPK